MSVSFPLAFLIRYVDSAALHSTGQFCRSFQPLLLVSLCLWVFLRTKFPCMNVSQAVGFFFTGPSSSQQNCYGSPREPLTGCVSVTVFPHKIKAIFLYFKSTVAIFSVFPFEWCESSKPKFWSNLISWELRLLFFAVLERFFFFWSWAFFHHQFSLPCLGLVKF